MNSLHHSKPASNCPAKPQQGCGHIPGAPSAKISPDIRSCCAAGCAQGSNSLSAPAPTPCHPRLRECVQSFSACSSWLADEQHMPLHCMSVCSLMRGHAAEFPCAELAPITLVQQPQACPAALRICSHVGTAVFSCMPGPGLCYKPQNCPCQHP